MTTPGLEKYYIKRSYIRKDMEYIYMCHGLTSANLTTPKGSYDEFDTIFCVGKHNFEEFREAEQIYHTKEKKSCSMRVWTIGPSDRRGRGYA